MSGGAFLINKNTSERQEKKEPPAQSKNKEGVSCESQERTKHGGMNTHTHTHTHTHTYTGSYRECTGGEKQDALCFILSGSNQLSSEEEEEEEEEFTHC